MMNTRIKIPNLTQEFQFKLKLLDCKMILELEEAALIFQEILPIQIN